MGKFEEIENAFMVHETKLVPGNGTLCDFTFKGSDYKVNEVHIGDLGITFTITEEDGDENSEIKKWSSIEFLPINCIDFETKKKKLI